MNFWLDNAVEPRRHVLVDCGYLNEKLSRDRADKILKHVARTNVVIAGFSRILVRIPPTKVDKVLKAIPQIKIGAGTYCWTTHGWAS